MSIEDIKDLLSRVRFPTTREAILGYAEERGQNEMKVFLQKLPEQMYKNTEEVLQKLPGLDELDKLFK